MRRFVIFVSTLCLCAGAAFAQSAAAANSDQQSSAAEPSPHVQQAVTQNLKDIHFDFDKADLRDEDRQILQQNADWLKSNPDVTISISGDADERGDIVYNLALSHQRAETTRDALVGLGVDPNHIDFATGWGKLYPVCNQSDESCWSQNRRAHFTPGTMLQTERVADVTDTSSTTAGSR